MPDYSEDRPLTRAAGFASGCGRHSENGTLEDVAGWRRGRRISSAAFGILAAILVVAGMVALPGTWAVESLAGERGD
jgi:hypothetical protein